MRAFLLIGFLIFALAGCSGFPSRRPLEKYEAGDVLTLSENYSWTLARDTKVIKTGRGWKTITFPENVKSLTIHFTKAIQSEGKFPQDSALRAIQSALAKRQIRITTIIWANSSPYSQEEKTIQEAREMVSRSF